MKSIVIAFLVMFTITAINGTPAKRVFKDFNTFLEKYMVPDQINAKDSLNSKRCFEIYLPKLQDVAEQWEREDNKCNNDAEESRQGIEKYMLEKLNQINETADDVCDQIQQCQALKDTSYFFYCFSTTRPEISDKVYQMTVNASENYAEQRHQLEFINSYMYKCKNASERAYVEKTSQIYKDLDLCIKYGPADIEPTPEPEPEPEETPEPTPEPAPEVISEEILPVSAFKAKYNKLNHEKRINEKHQYSLQQKLHERH